MNEPQIVVRGLRGQALLLAQVCLVAPKKQLSRVRHLSHWLGARCHSRLAQVFEERGQRVTSIADPEPATTPVSEERVDRYLIDVAQRHSPLAAPERKPRKHGALLPDHQRAIATHRQSFGEGINTTFESAIFCVALDCYSTIGHLLSPLLALVPGGRESITIMPHPPSVDGARNRQVTRGPSPHAA